MTKVKNVVVAAGRGTASRKVGVVIPGAEFMTKEELAKAKQNERQRKQMAKRRGKDPEEITEFKQTNQELRSMDTKEMVEMAKETRNIAIQVLNKKLINLNSNEEELSKINMATLATVFGILFDKAQLAAGLSTENIAIHAKIDINMTSDVALAELNKMRESYSQ